MYVGIRPPDADRITARPRQPSSSSFFHLHLLHRKVPTAAEQQRHRQARRRRRSGGRARKGMEDGREDGGEEGGQEGSQNVTASCMCVQPRCCWHKHPILFLHPPPSLPAPAGPGLLFRSTLTDDHCWVKGGRRRWEEVVRRGKSSAPGKLHHDCRAPASLVTSSSQTSPTPSYRPIIITVRSYRS